MPFEGPDRRQKVLVLLTMCFALFMAMLDNTVVNVALPTLSRELGAGVSGLQWVVDGYALAFASMLLTGGILGDRYGRKRLFVIGLIAFTAASVLCGLSQSTGQLVVARALQGIGAAVLMPGTLAIITNTFPERERAQAIGIWAGVSGLALALGPTLGGWFVENFGWQSVFFLNIPIGLAGIVTAVVVVPESRQPNARKLDIPGVLLGTAMLTSVTFALIEANEKGWSDPLIVGCLVASAALLVAFITWERRTANPMMPLSLYKSAAFSTGNAVAFAISFAMFGTFFFASLYFQLVREYTPFEAGYHMLPITGMIFFVAPQAGRLAGKYGPRWVMTFGLTTAGTGLLMFSQVGPDTAYWWLVPVLMTMGIGMGSTMAPMTAAVMNAVGPEQAGLGAATTNTSREVGGVFGVAFLGTLLTTVLRSSLETGLAKTALAPAAQAAILGTAGHGRLDASQLADLPAPLAVAVRHAFAVSFMDGFQAALMVGGVILLAAALLANRFISGRPSARDAETGPDAAAAAAAAVP